MKRKSAVAALMGLAMMVLGTATANAAAPPRLQPLGDVVVSDSITAYAGPRIGSSHVTRCKIEVQARFRTDISPVTVRFAGRNDCSRALYQTGRARLLNETRAIEKSAPAFPIGMKTRAVSQSTYQQFSRGLERTVQHHTVVRAPLGQVWKVVPQGCRGKNTTRLTCTLEQSFIV
ncbi:hypothetical protein [Allokutzneria oryzae]|uniref:Uncharacterized protein n=1 Tax=Allokutzneria oryzae TaxID=1378989 RepID=A0ABV6A1K0_9PSEU